MTTEKTEEALRFLRFFLFKNAPGDAFSRSQTGNIPLQKGLFRLRAGEPSGGLLSVSRQKVGKERA